MPDDSVLTHRQRVVKRVFDLMIAALALIVTSPVLAVAWVAASLSSGGSGIFRQQRVGRNGELFEVLKLRTMRVGTAGTSVTTSNDVRITQTGRVLRKLKIDELPQLINVIRGEMSIVGPRPDVPGFADTLSGRDRIVLSVRPGITGPAAIAYRHEEELLAEASDPEEFNRTVIWPDKVRLNRDYVADWTLQSDLRYLMETVMSISRRQESR